MSHMDAVGLVLRMNRNLRLEAKHYPDLHELWLLFLSSFSQDFCQYTSQQVPHVVLSLALSYLIKHLVHC